MNCIQELEAQNLQDSWSILYFGLAEYLLNQSEQGEELVRSAVRTYGELIGNREREQQRKKGIKQICKIFIYGHRYVLKIQDY